MNDNEVSPRFLDTTTQGSAAQSGQLSGRGGKSKRQDKEIAIILKITQKKASRWRKRFLTLGLAGLERDASRPGRTPKLTASLVRRVVHLTTRQKPTNATHWSTRTMAAVVGISEASVRRIWSSHGLKPHRVESFKISNDPEFAEKLRDIVGLF